MNLPFTLDRELISNLQNDEKDWLHVPDELRAGLGKRGVVLSTSAYIAGDKDRGWRLVDYHGFEARAYDLGITDKGLEVRRHSTSGLSTVLTDYALFETGLELREYGGSNDSETRDVFTIAGMRDGRARAHLDKEQQQRWDYFFPLADYLVGYPHRQKIRGWKKELESNEGTFPRDLKFSLGLALAFLFLVIFVLSGREDSFSLYCGSFFAVLTLPVIGIASVVYLVRYIRSKRNRGYMRHWIKSLEQEARHLQAVAEQHPPGPTADEVESWLQEDLEYLDRSILRMLHLDPPSDISELTLSEGLPEPGNHTSDPSHTPLKLVPRTLNPRNLSGILLETWGMIQPDDAPGVQEIDSLHLGAIRFSPYGLHVGVNFFQFILPTGTQLLVCGCFWDFILKQQKGQLTDEFFFTDVVSLKTRVSQVSNSLTSKTVSETTVFSLTVASGDSIQVSLKDKTVLTNVTKRIQQNRQDHREELNKVRQEDGTPTAAAPSAAPPKEIYEVVDEELLPETRAAATLAFIRPLLRKHHQQPEVRE